ncbi:hypothetical protein CONPUDRAFT_157318 [Coniophora puteana RWD-64-598 SS2]|uniref:SWR1-complex protein 5 n=1 Tax=Coniophora puteana (strain RWD-64-598) TaxID=741705 RepID=A0A5M3MDI1_CONPW|nr:uncharacterized protein CONPUDRAFT_157318 [Coniophora puteana RWD-64-598 SS2]EIW77046.1 hypothetical protein CONPUDRAFT_157318 [Coniophora puteana RWD-64-598 SS2]
MLPKPPEDDYDSAEDGDYVPPKEPDSDDSEDGEALLEEPVKEATTEESLEQKKKREALWASFQASATSSNGDGGSALSPITKEKRMIKVEKRYRFAGKEIVEVVEVAEDSPDAKKWPQWNVHGQPEDTQVEKAQPASASLDSKPSNLPSTNTPPIPPTSLSSQSTPPEPSTAREINSGLASTSASASAHSSPPTATTGTPAPKRPGPRKPRTSLPSLPSSGNKAKKLTTLDKSAMDWRAHVSTQPSTVADELVQNQRGGGYLEKVEFLDRVEERKESVLEEGRGKRRKLGG